MDEHLETHDLAGATLQLVEDGDLDEDVNTYRHCSSGDRDAGNVREH